MCITAEALGSESVIYGVVSQRSNRIASVCVMKRQCTCLNVKLLQYIHIPTIPNFKQETSTKKKLE